MLIAQHTAPLHQDNGLGMTIIAYLHVGAYFPDEAFTHWMRLLLVHGLHHQYIEPGTMVIMHLTRLRGQGRKSLNNNVLIDIKYLNTAALAERTTSSVDHRTVLRPFTCRSIPLESQAQDYII